MVVVKYKKTGEGMFFSHINMIRILNRVINISGLNVERSEDGKTRNIYFSEPTRVGVESLCEYVVIDTSATASEVETMLENLLPSWLKILEVFDVAGKFNVAKMSNCSKYEISFEDYKSSKPKIKEYLSQEEILIKYMLHGQEKVVDVKPRIYDYSLEENSLFVVAGAKDNSIRIDEFVKSMLKFLNKTGSDYKIVKLELYADGVNGERTNIDQIAKANEKDDKK